MFVYLARPIDQAGESSFLNNLTGQIKAKLWLASIGAFMPHDAYLAKTTDKAHAKFIHEANQMSIGRADALVAILPAGIPTLGTPCEIDLALALNKPTVIFSDLLGSVQLAAWAEQGAIVIDMLRDDFKLPDSDDLATMLRIAPRPEEQDVTYDLLVAGKAANLTPGRYSGDAGADLALLQDECLMSGEYRLLPTGVRVAIPHGSFGWITGRSSTWSKFRCDVRSAIIDSGYRGELMVGVQNLGDSAMVFAAGTRLAQMILLPAWVGEIQQVDELPEAERGHNGYGSSGS